MLAPPTCAACGAPGAPVCSSCRAELRPPPSLPPPPAVDVCTAVLAYDGPGRDVVARLKYRNHRASLAGLATAMASTVSRPPDVVTWAPTTAERRRARGFDHAELLARAVAAQLHRPCRALLARGSGPPQTGRPLADRRRGPVLVARGAAPHRVLVVDDVVTSGATVAAAATALRRAGAREVDVVAAARTPPPKLGGVPQENHPP